MVQSANKISMFSEACPLSDKTDLRQRMSWQTLRIASSLSRGGCGSQARRRMRRRSGVVVISVHDARIDRGRPAISPTASFRRLVPWRLVSSSGGGFTFPLSNGGRGWTFLHVVSALRDGLGGGQTGALPRVTGRGRANVRSAPTSANLVLCRRRKRWIILARS